MKVKILDVEIDALKKTELGEVLVDSFKANKQTRIAKVNTEFILRAYKNKEFAKTLDDFEIKIADGSGVLWAAKYLSLPLVKEPFVKELQAVYQFLVTSLSLVFHPEYCSEPIPERFPGVEALKMMLSIAEEEGVPVYFFGSEEKILAKALPTLLIEYPKLKIAGSHPGYGYQDKVVKKDINEKKPGLLVVALGSPKQEYWIRDNIEKLTTAKIAVGEGGSLDFLAGEQKRAPEMMRKAGLEWLWRLFSNKDKTGSSRVRRVWNAVPVFMWEVLKWKVKYGETKN